MRNVRGIEFGNEIADVVEALVRRIEEKIGSEHLFASRMHFGLKFALRLPDESKGKNKKAYRLFLLISPTADGAVARRPRPPKTDWKRMELTTGTIDEVFRAGMSWFFEVQKMKVPKEYEPTENRLVLAGGQFESDRRKF